MATNNSGYRCGPAYQIDHLVEETGKIIASTKRKIKFVVGFSNMEAVESGALGIECRGREYTIELVWSLTSGKHRILVDGNEMHFSIAESNESKFTHSWVVPGGVTLTLIAHAANVSSKFETPEDWRQYDLHIGRKSFFDLPHIFQIGVTEMKANNVAPQPQQPAKVETMDPLDFSMPAPAPTAHTQTNYHAPAPSQYAPTVVPSAQDNTFAFANPAPQMTSAPSQLHQYAPQPLAPPVASPPPSEFSAPAPVSPAYVAAAPATTASQPVAVSAPPIAHPVSPATPAEEVPAAQQAPQPLGLESAMQNNLANFNLGFPSAPTPAQNELTMAPTPGMTVSSPAGAAPPAQQSLAEMQAGHEGAPAREVMRSASPQQPAYGGYGYQQTYPAY
mmetsp:Transcript_496/g.1502  ORF Transcript_496/g.1502 Transcript_496/m.1502 type:complete len:390 (-) Transcript_496:251-1420(-)